MLLKLLLRLFPSIRKMDSDCDALIAVNAKLESVNAKLEVKISKLEESLDVEKKAVAHWQRQAEDAKARARNSGHELDEVRQDRNALNQRIVNQQSLIDGNRSDKEKLVPELNKRQSTIDDFRRDKKALLQKNEELQKEINEQIVRYGGLEDILDGLKKENRALKEQLEADTGE